MARRAWWAVLAAAALCAVAAALFLFLRARPLPAVRKIDLSAIDAQIAAGSLDTARETLEGIRPLPRSEGELLQILKRASLVCRSSGDFRLAADLGTRALAANGRSGPVGAVAAWGLLRVGRLAEADKVLARGGLPHAAADLLRGETALRLGRKWDGADELTRSLVALEKESAPAVFSAAGVRTGEPRLFMDAALLLAEEGRAAEAAHLVRQSLPDAAFDDPTAAIFWDAGDAEAALGRLSRWAVARPGKAEVLFREADCLQELGRAAESEKALDRGLPLAPRLSWTGYADLAWFAEGRGDFGLAGRRLEDGLAFFPDSRDLAIRKARLLVRTGKPDAADRVLSALLERDPADSEAALLQLDIEAGGLSPEQYRARLWKLFNRSPADPSVFDALSEAAIGAMDWEGAAIALEQHEQAVGEADARLLVLRGVISAMRGDPTAAEAAFREAASAAPDGRARYDLALLMTQKGSTRAALQELRLAEEEYRGAHHVPENAVLARMALAEGVTRLKDGDETGARAAFQRALERDPSNLRAALMLRKLEAGIR
jgi:tetratricopeptide (TPR) repeat protein